MSIFFQTRQLARLFWLHVGQVELEIIWLAGKEIHPFSCRSKITNESKATCTELTGLTIHLIGKRNKDKETGITFN